MVAGPPRSLFSQKPLEASRVVAASVPKINWRHTSKFKVTNVFNFETRMTTSISSESQQNKD